MRLGTIIRGKSISEQRHQNALIFKLEDSKIDARMFFLRLVRGSSVRVRGYSRSDPSGARQAGS